jgi:type VI protein secretion system component VasF
MDMVRIEQLREILTFQVLPRLAEVRRRQTVLQATVWIGMACLLSGMVVILGLIGVLVNAH